MGGPGNEAQALTDEQIIGILKKHEAGTPVLELCRKHGFSDARAVHLVTMTTITERSFKETAKLSSLAASLGYAFDIGGETSLSLYDYAGTDGANPQDLYPEELLAIQGLELLKVSLADEYFYDKQVALSPAFKALVSIAVGSFVVPGLFATLGFTSSSLAGSFTAAFGSKALGATLSAAAYNAATAFTSTFIVESLDGVVSGDFDIGDILKGAVFSGVTAGLTSAINVSNFIKPDTALGKSLAGNIIPGFGNAGQFIWKGLLDAGLDGVISSGLSSVVYGTDFGSGVLAEVVSYVADGLAGAGIREASDATSHGSFSLEKLIAKATINCLAAELKGASCASGALGSLVTELVVATGSTLGVDGNQSIDERMDDYRDRLKMIAAIAGYFVSGGKAENVHATANAAVLDFDNNLAPLVVWGIIALGTAAYTRACRKFLWLTCC